MHINGDFLVLGKSVSGMPAQGQGRRLNRKSQARRASWRNRSVRTLFGTTLSAALLASMTFSGGGLPAFANPAEPVEVAVSPAPALDTPPVSADETFDDSSAAGTKTPAPSDESSEAEPRASEPAETESAPSNTTAKPEGETGDNQGNGPVADLPSPKTSPRSMMAARLANPELPSQCGLSVAIVLDLSNSLANQHVVASKQAANAVVDSLQGTPSSVGVYTFATFAPDRTNSAIAKTAVSTTAGATSVKNGINGIQRVPSNVGGTNWDAALRQIPQGQYDIVLFVTDGNPTAYGTPHTNRNLSTPRNNTDFGLSTEEIDLSSAETAADALKSTGSFVMGLAVGQDINIPNIVRISGSRAGTDYFSISDYDLLAAKLAEIALTNCRGTVSIVKQVRDLDGNLAPAGGWVFTGRAGDNTSPGSATTGDDGAVNFQVEDLLTEARTVGFTETQKPGFELEPQNGANAKCVNNVTGQVVPASNLGAFGFTVSVKREDAISCEVINRMIPAEPTVEKSSDPVSGTEISPDDEVTYKLTFGNSGHYPADVDYVDHLSGVLDDADFIEGSLTAGNGLNAVRSGNQITITGSIEPGEPVVVSYKVKVKTEDFTDGWLRNFVRPAGEQPPTECLPEDPLCTEHPIPGELTVEKSSDPESGQYVAPGETVDYTLTFDNSGASEVEVNYVDHLVDVLDDAEFVEGSLVASNGLSTVRNGNQITITGDLPKESTATVTYSVTVKTAEFGNGIARNFLVPEGETPPEECEPEDPNCTEHPILGSVIWEKVDEANNLLEGSEWKLTGPDGAVIEILDCTVEPCTGADSNPDAGKFLVTGLEWGQYTLVETKAPAGYLLNDNEFVIDIQGDIEPAKLLIDLGQITNEQREGLALPLTGGLGTDEFLIGGGIALVAALGIIAWNRRKGAAEVVPLKIDG